VFVPGGLVLGLAMSSSARDLHEILHEELLNVNYTNHVHPSENVTALTYVKRMDENISGDLESLVVTTLGIKSVLQSELDGIELPTELFTNSKLTTRQVVRPAPSPDRTTPPPANSLPRALPAHRRRSAPRSARNFLARSSSRPSARSSARRRAPRRSCCKRGVQLDGITGGEGAFLNKQRHTTCGWVIFAPRSWFSSPASSNL
jgi:hypothetical protein